MKALIVEDDFNFVQEILQDLEEAFPPLRGRIDSIKTERKFRELFADLSQPLDYSVIILDVMVRWDDDCDTVPPPDARKEGYFRTGVRCLDLIRKRPETKGVPVIFHSALEPEQYAQLIHQKDISMDNVEFVKKSGKPGPLVEAVKGLLQ